MLMKLLESTLVELFLNGADHIVIQENVIKEKNQIIISENEVFPRHIRKKGN